MIACIAVLTHFYEVVGVSSYTCTLYMKEREHKNKNMRKGWNWGPPFLAPQIGL